MALKEIDTKRFAEKEFKKLGPLRYEWNILHSKYMIKALNELSKYKRFDLARLKALAWIHDIGKIKSLENHGKFGVEILKKEFILDKIDEDCISNHGSAGKPKTDLGKIFRVADGISMFYTEAVFFRFYSQSEEGYTFEEVKTKFKRMYKKYLKAYSDFPIAIKILKDKARILNEI